MDNDREKKNNIKSLDEHTFEYRPWGKFENLLESDYCKVKRIIVKPGGRLSYQYHYKRSEVWVVVQGEACATIDNPNGTSYHECTYGVGEVIEIPIEIVVEILIEMGEYMGGGFHQEIIMNPLVLVSDTRGMLF